MGPYPLSEQKFLPKPSVYAYLAEYGRMPRKVQLYAAHHLWQTVVLFFLWYATVSYLTVPRLYKQFIAVTPSLATIERSMPSFNEDPVQSNVITPQLTSTPIPTSTPLPPSLVPVELHIPKLNINAPVESVGQTKTYEMDVPKNAAHVAWYVYGAKPGEEGNAVINGHYDTPSGKPAVFYKLQTLEIGDELAVISDDGTEKTFIVTGKERHPYKSFPEEYVFHTKPGKNLNLITCGGIWNVKDKIYNERVVVYTQLKES